MRYAKSLHFGEILCADEANEHEAKYLNMTCNSCGETVFHRRAHMRKINDSEVEIPAMWVHRNGKNKSEIRECELRSQSFGSPEELRKKAIARGQTLKAINSNLKKIFGLFYIKKRVPKNYPASVAHDFKQHYKQYPELVSESYDNVKYFVVPNFDVLWVASGDAALERATTKPSGDVASDKYVAELVEGFKSRDRIFDREIARSVLDYLSGLSLQAFFTTTIPATSYYWACERIRRHQNNLSLDLQYPMGRDLAINIMGALFEINWAAALLWAREDASAKSVRGFGS